MSSRIVAFAFLLLLKSALSAFAQQRTAIDYYRLINKAELAICDSDIDRSYKLYTEAFKINKNKPFSRDLLNAFHCAMDTRHYPAAERYLARLLARGINEETLANLKKSYTGLDLERINSFITKYPNQTTKKNVMADSIDRLTEIDQSVRHYFQSHRTDGRYMNDSVRQVDRNNAATLFRMFVQYGLPDEDEIGTFDNNPGSLPRYWVIIAHNRYDVDVENPTDFDTMLYKGIFSFAVNANYLIDVLNTEDDNGFFPDHKFRYKSTVITMPLTVEFGAYGFGKEREVWPKYLHPDVEKRINKDRSSFGLGTLDDQRRKFLFSEAHLSDKYEKYSIKALPVRFREAQTDEERDEMKKGYLKYKPALPR
ncbi:hypothetical protein [Pedobacter frigoris]|uniref:hypothetical protein n=1 Tax=Pedobacter frigoris TaxID=2571272 RepID=UPI00292D5AA7|nr:hypothetical protein [Pedobacter frigoris]